MKRALGAAGRTGVGKNLVNAAVQADPGLKRYPSVERWPDSLDGFEDLAFLFSSNQLSHGIASLQLDEAALLYRLARRVTAGRGDRRDRPLQGRHDADARERAAGRSRALVVRPPRRAPRRHERAAAGLGAADGARPLRPLRTASTSSSATRAPPRRRRGRARSSSSTATTPTRAPAPTTSAGASWSRRAATCSSTTQSTWADTETTIPGSRVSSARSSGTTRASSGSRTRARSRTSRAAPDAARRSRPLLQRARGHAGRARVAARDRDCRRRQRLDATARPRRSRSASPTSSSSGPASTSASPAATTSGSGARSTAAPTGSCSSTTTPRSSPGSSRRWRRRPPRDPTPACSPARCSSPTPTGSGTPEPASTPSSAAAGTRASASRTSRATLADTARATGAAMAVSRAAIDAAGLLDEELFLYAEDLEWCLRIREAGFAVVYVPEARVRHRVSARHRRCRLADDELLRGAQHARGRRALPAAAPRADRRHDAGSSSRRGSCSPRAARPRPGRRCAVGATTAAGGWAAGASLPTVANERSSFYRRVLEQLLDEGVLRRDMTVLVVAGGPADRDVFHELGFEHVTISNVDEEVAAEELAPYEWSFQDAEALTYADGSFDLTVVSAGLHHCRSPHRALLELYRVARVAALALESRDSALMRVAVRLGRRRRVRARGGRRARPSLRRRREHEHAELRLPLVGARGREDGRLVRARTPAIGSASSASSSCRRRCVEIDQGARASVLRLARPVVTGITRVLPRQANLFAFVIEKPQLPGDLQPWMRADGSELRPDPEVVGRRYGDRPIEPRAPPGGLGAPGRGRCAVGGADPSGPQGRALGRGGVLRHRRGRDRARQRGRRDAGTPCAPRAGARLRLRRRPPHPRARHALRVGVRRRHLGRDGRAGETAERGVPGLRVPGQRRARTSASWRRTRSTSSTRASRCSTSRPCPRSSGT